ncbi:hypothetical protein FGG08_005722 [Glutinoglossum americanum]|uniref:Aminotransferase class I/classII large domain-containing protein n=1 Tax=Glutinoglossum americanum TaxID=1670608 RepID=A0A9P8KY88_9PEZI|nr:hypothetical protein FGG08_005722 [Glutinoglossum americanum]
MLRKLTYGAIPGSEELRSNIARNLYSSGASKFPSENVLITTGAIAANFLLMYSLVGPGDHVICVFPTYQQLYSVPESFGAEVSLWRLQEHKNYVPDVEELKGLIKPNTKLIVLNNPNNPTGSTTPRSVLEKVVDIAKSRDIIILCDEVYRPLFHSLPPTDPEAPPSILSMGYHKVIATGSLSKAFALAGIRVGWIASRDPSIIEACIKARDYTTISVSQLDDQVASFALSPGVIHNLLSRNMELAKTNLVILDEFVSKFSKTCSWIRPTAGTTAFVKFQKDGRAVDDQAFCKAVLDKTGVLLVPGDKCFGVAKGDFEGCVRIGYAGETEELVGALKLLEEFLETDF